MKTENNENLAGMYTLTFPYMQMTFKVMVKDDGTPFMRDADKTFLDKALAAIVPPVEWSLHRQGHAIVHRAYWNTDRVAWQFLGEVWDHVCDDQERSPNNPKAKTISKNEERCSPEKPKENRHLTELLYYFLTKINDHLLSNGKTHDFYDLIFGRSETKKRDEVRFQASAGVGPCANIPLKTKRHLLKLLKRELEANRHMVLCKFHPDSDSTEILSDLEPILMARSTNDMMDQIKNLFAGVCHSRIGNGVELESNPSRMRLQHASTGSAINLHILPHDEMGVAPYDPDSGELALTKLHDWLCDQKTGHIRVIHINDKGERRLIYKVNFNIDCFKTILFDKIYQREFANVLWDIAVGIYAADNEWSVEKLHEFVKSMKG